MRNERRLAMVLTMFVVVAVGCVLAVVQFRGSPLQPESAPATEFFAQKVSFRFAAGFILLAWFPYTLYFALDPGGVIGEFLGWQSSSSPL